MFCQTDATPHHQPCMQAAEEGPEHLSPLRRTGNASQNPGGACLEQQASTSHTILLKHHEVGSRYSWKETAANSFVTSFLTEDSSQLSIFKCLQCTWKVYFARYKRRSAITQHTTTKPGRLMYTHFENTNAS